MINMGRDCSGSSKSLAAAEEKKIAFHPRHDFFSLDAGALKKFACSAKQSRG